MTPAWIVCDWPPLLVNAHATPDLHFVHLGTSVLGAHELTHRNMGQTVWGNASKQPAAGVAWDWVEIQHGVFAMADPLGVVTNLKFVGPGGQSLSNTEVALCLNEIVRTLPWQNEIMRALEH